MNIRTFGLLGLSAVALAACGEDAAAPAAPAGATTQAATPASAAPATSGTITLVGEGLKVSTATPNMIAFGTPKDAAIAAVKAVMGGEPAMSNNADCPTGATEDYAFGSKLHLITRGGQFIGWQSDEAGPATSSGVHAGSPRTAATASDSFSTVDSSFEQTQISVDTVSGFLSDDGTKVDMLYAGDTCLAS